MHDSSNLFRYLFHFSHDATLAETRLMTVLAADGHPLRQAHLLTRGSTLHLLPAEASSLQLLRDIWAEMGRREQHLLYLHLGLGLSVAYISQALRLTPTQVAQRLEVALERLAFQLGEDDVALIQHWLQMLLPPVPSLSADFQSTYQARRPALQRALRQRQRWRRIAVTLGSLLALIAAVAVAAWPRRPLPVADVPLEWQMMAAPSIPTANQVDIVSLMTEESEDGVVTLAVDVAYRLDSAERAWLYPAVRWSPAANAYDLSVGDAKRVLRGEGVETVQIAVDPAAEIGGLRGGTLWLRVSLQHPLLPPPSPFTIVGVSDPVSLRYYDLPLVDDPTLSQRPPTP